MGRCLDGCEDVSSSKERSDFKNFHTKDDKKSDAGR